jgi:hypothetical protein
MIRRTTLLLYVSIHLQTIHNHKACRRVYSVMYTERDNTTWGCHIYWTDDSMQVQHDSIQWCNRHGQFLPEHERIQILICQWRLDLFCDADHMVQEKVDALLLYLRLMLIRVMYMIPWTWNLLLTEQSTRTYVTMICKRLLVTDEAEYENPPWFFFSFIASRDKAV